MVLRGPVLALRPPAVDAPWSSCGGVDGVHAGLEGAAAADGGAVLACVVGDHDGARIRQTVVDVGGRLEFSTPKTKSSEASVPLTDRAVHALLQWRLGQDIDRQSWGPAYEDQGLVFARENGAPLRPEYVTRRFVALSKAAGLRQVRLHDLRHGAASLMLAAGVPMAIVSKMLRHSSIGITVDTYGHLSEGTARTAPDAIGALLDAAFEQAAGAVAETVGDHSRPERCGRGPQDCPSGCERAGQA